MDRIGGYKLLHSVGEGSHGTLYRAEKEGAPYAFKLFKKGSPSEVLQEGKILSRIHHPHVVRYVDEGIEGQTPYLITEWVEGPTLEQSARPTDFPLLLKRLVEILGGLDALHQKGLVHGDLKAGNILIGPEGAKLVDLGLARSMALKGSQVPAGTLATLAPELLFGQPVSRASDFYSLGMVLYHWITGGYPFESEKASAVIRWHLFETPFYPFRHSPFIPAPFGDFVLKLLSKNPADRPQNVGEIFSWLKEKFGDIIHIPREEKEAISLEEEFPEGFELHGAAIRFYESKSSLTEEERLILAELHYQQGHPTRALEILQGLELTVAWILRAKILTRMGSFEEAEAVLGKVKEASLASLNARGVLDFYLGRMDSSLQCFTDAENLAKASGERANLAVAYNNIANVMLEKEERGKAEKYFRRSVELAREEGDRIHEGMFQMSLGYFFHRGEFFSEALSAYEESLRILEAVGQKSEKARVLLNRANLFVNLGGLQEASADLHRAQNIFQNRSLFYLLAYSRLIEGEILRRSGKYGEALERFRESDESLSRLGRSTDAFWARLHQAECLFELKEFEKARAQLKKLYAQTASGTEKSIAAHLNFLKARLLWELQAPTDEILQSFQKAESSLQEARSEETLLLLHYAWGVFLFQKNKFSEARAHLQQAQERLGNLFRQIPPEWKDRYLKISPSESIERMLRDMEPLLLPEREKKESGLLKENLFEQELKALQKELLVELDLTLLVEKIIDRVIDLTRAERGFIIWNDKPDPRILVSRKIDHLKIKNSENQISWSIAMEVLRSGEPLVTVDAMMDDRFSISASIHQLKLRSILCFPFKKENEVLGAIYLDDRERDGAFQPAIAQALKPFADLVAQILFNAKRFFEIQGDLKETRKKLEAAQAELKIKYDYHHIVGQHPKMLEIFKILDRVTEVEVPLLILGESGVGKELAAKAVHFNGTRASHPFVSINCQAIPEGLFESELFGHARGAFTGALTDRAGLLEQSHRGTLFLDEIGDMPLALQGKLLRVLQDGKLRRVGDKEEKPVDFRVIAATHRDLKTLIQEGKFRDDLSFRINVVEIQIPPLRERMEDLPLLVDHFLEEYARRHGGKKKKVSTEALSLLARYTWPGNVREMENTLTNACVFAEDDRITPEAFRYKQELWRGDANKASGEKRETRNQKPEVKAQKSFTEAKKEFEKEIIAQALRENHGNITRTAILLKMARPQLSRMVKKYRIQV